jgi:hypothetical protein
MPTLPIAQVDESVERLSQPVGHTRTLATLQGETRSGRPQTLIEHVLREHERTIGFIQDSKEHRRFTLNGTPSKST